MRAWAVFLVACAASTASAEDFALAPGCREPVDVVRVSGETPLEHVRMRLVDCSGVPLRDALVELSVLARPYDVDPPDERADRATIAPGVVRLDDGLVTRLQAIADRFPGREIHVVSGYRRTARASSRHRQGRALDLRVDGVAREEVVELARTLLATGVGYYPNSTFTHIDVRERRFYWVDRSAPGERAAYVLRTGDPLAPMLPPDIASAASAASRDASASAPREPSPSVPPSDESASDAEPDEHDGELLDAAGVEAFRREVRAQLRAFGESVLGRREPTRNADAPARRTVRESAPRPEVEPPVPAAP